MNEHDGNARTREATRWPGIRKVSGAGGRARYEARLRGPDGRTRSKTFDRLDDARAWLRAMSADRQRPGGWKDPRLDRLTLAAWLRGPRWSKHCQGLRPKTQAIYAAATTRCIEHLGGIPLARLKRSDVEAMRDALLEHHNPGGANQVLRVLTTALQLAVDAEILDRNPATRVRASDDVRPEDRDDRRALSPDEAGRLLAATPERWRAFVATALVLGLRFSELAALRRGDVDLGAGTLRVERQAYWLSGRLVTSPPKTRSGVRTLPIPADLARLLAAHLDSEHAQAGDDGLIFPSNGGKVLDNSTFRQATWNPSVARAGLRPVVFHACRVSSITWTLDQGASPKVAAAIAGHSTPAVTLAIYSRALASSQRAATDAVGGQLAGALDAALAAAPNVVPIARRVRRPA